MAAAVGLVLTGPFAASALVLDDFGDDFAVEIGLGGLPNPTVESGGTNTAGGAAGGARAAILERTLGGGSASIDTNLSEPNALSVSTGAGVVATAQIIWDGNDDITLDTSGLGVDVTDGGVSQLLRLVVAADQSNVGIRVTFHEGDNQSIADFVTSGGNTFGAPQVLDVPFAAFVAGGTGFADLTNVGAITMEIFGPTSYDVQITEFQTVIPEPGAFALVALGLSGLALKGRRRTH